MKLLLHHVRLPVLTDTVDFGLAQDFCIVHALDVNQFPQAPACDDTSYIVPCGVQGLPYLPALGLGGHRQRFHFTTAVNSVIVAVGSGLRPVPLLPPPPPPPTVLSATNTYASRSSRDGTFYAFTVAFSDGTNGLFAFTYPQLNSDLTQLVGMLKVDFVAAYPYYSTGSAYSYS